MAKQWARPSDMFRCHGLSFAALAFEKCEQRDTNRSIIIVVKSMQGQWSIQISK